MADYIERERLKEAFNADLQTLQTVDEHTMNLILMDIDEAPAADVVPVVRCRECKHAYINSFSAAAGRALCRRFTNLADGIQVVMDSDDFCSYGERAAGGK